MTKPIFNLSYPNLKIEQSDERFPVHRIYCVGRNYRAHTIEMGGDPERDVPFFFSKPADAACQTTELPWPTKTNELHHEVELVVAIAEVDYGDNEQLTLEQSEQCIFAYAVGVDLTRRDLQRAAKEKSRPWDTAKAFDFSAPLGNLVRASEWQPSSSSTIQLSINDEIKQQSNLDKLIWNIPELIKELSAYYRLQAGDLIFTGTPAGVGEIKIEDTVEAQIKGLPKLRFSFKKN